MDMDYEYYDWLDGETSARDLLAQFQAQSNEPRKKPAQPPAPPVIRRELKLAAVEIPAIPNSEEYDFLPGHFDVHCVINEKLDQGVATSYQIKLRSGELQTVSPSRLTSLNNGQEALDQFYSEDDLEEQEDSEGYLLRKRPTQDDSSLSSEITHYTSESSEEDSEFSNKMRRSRRTTRARNTFSAYFYNLDSDDDKARDRASSSSEDIIGSTLPGRLRLRRGRQHVRRPTRHTIPVSDTESEHDAPKGTRFSTRQKKSIRKNLREMREDDIAEFREPSREKKYFGARETFHSMPPDSPFRRRHLNRCGVCEIYGDDSTKGILVFCQGCTTAYHQACLGPRATREHLVTKISDSEFILQCRHCLGVAYAKDSICPHLGCCIECKEQSPMSKPLRERLTPRQEQQLRQDNNGKDPITPVDADRVNNVNNLLFRCITCHRGFHFEHLPPLSETSNSAMATEDIVSQRVQEYSLRWQCQDCISAPGEIGTMVAWRPNDARDFVSDYTANMIEEVDKEYLIRWKGMSYYRTTWMPGSWVWGIGNSAMRRAFFRSPKNLHPRMTTEEAIPEDFMRVDIIFDVRYSDHAGDHTYEADMGRLDNVVEAYVKYKGLPYEEVVWEAPPDRNHTGRWNDFKSAYEDWVSRDYIHIPEQKSLEKYLSDVRKLNFKSSMVLRSQPEIMTGGKIMDYQLEGLNWMYYMWFKRQNAILADEMGLGKTIQVIGFFASLIQYHKCWPFLVVVPNSTCPNWRKEIKQWTPSVRVVTYYGSSFSRKLAQDHEMFSGNSRDLRCHIVVTSYETMTDDASRKVLARVPWAGLVADEGQRLKNDKSMLYESLSKLRFPFKILLTGTPLQNNTRELFNILQFCDQTIDAETLDAEYDVLSKENIPQLHNMIRPFFLRRTKAQVLTFLPPIVQIIVPVSMSVVQKKLYKSILAKNPLLIKAIFQMSDGRNLKQTERHNLNNILMQLRKCLCHPFVYSKAIEEETSSAAASHRQLVEAAGKFQLLQLMLPKLQERGHRVLIFSQFLDNLDLVEEFLDGLGLRYRRSMEDHRPWRSKSKLTTSMHTVIIMDPDFNPHQDMQALSRAHRIGQKNKVLVFQLMTRGSAEEKIMQIGKKKMVLDHVLIDRMISEEDDGRDLESILRHGAQALFDNDDSGDVRYDSEAVDRLLDRSQEEQARTPDENTGESQFSFARVWANDNQNMEGQLQDSEEDSLPNPTIWEKILHEREAAAAEEARKKAETFGRGKRKRNTVDYSTNIDDVSPKKPQKRQDDQDSDADFKADEAMADSSSDTGDVEAPEDSVLPEPKKGNSPSENDWEDVNKGIDRRFRRVADPSTVQPPESTRVGMDGNIERPVVCFVCKKLHPIGFCSLKTVGVEYCGLCGIAHFGHARTCPHLSSEIQVARMISALNKSKEDPKLIAEAKKYVQGIRGSLAQQRRRREAGSSSRLNNTNDGTPRQPGPSSMHPSQYSFGSGQHPSPAQPVYPYSSASAVHPAQSYTSPYVPVSAPTTAPTTSSTAQVIDLTDNVPPGVDRGMHQYNHASQPGNHQRQF
ncbi:hypothetical protein PHISCL_04039 [Aspergillus sclerotialis]|uniref:Helicase ATP-binding domain-containing protein n=1 Tax=Aspergillus sclerotialis TaxID=2070753 RepID=A0A3A3A0F4_9EURO|nr:hypothetical protein PHISCL_04039 [Aspergillus sclerotialis]